MKNLFLLLALLTAIPSHAAILGAPFQPETDRRFDLIENPAASGVLPQGNLKGEKGLATGTGGTFLSHHAKAIFSVVGSFGATAIATPIVIPAGAIIERAYFLVDTQVAGATSTLAFQCNSAGDLLATASQTGVTAGSIIAGIPVGSPSTMVYTSAGCTVKYVIGTANITAGKLEMFIDYVVAK